jgi:antitoxin VapB
MSHVKHGYGVGDQMGKGEAVLLPKAFQVKCKELEIWRDGDEIVLSEKKRGLARARVIGESAERDVSGRPQRRKGLVG